MASIIPHRPQALPSITDLGMLAYGARTDADPALLEDENARGSLLCDRDAALGNLLLTFRAKTLSDAVTQLYAAFIASDALINFEQPDGCPLDEAGAIRRALLSSIPVIAAAAGFDLADIGAEYIPEFATREFPAEA